MPEDLNFHQNTPPTPTYNRWLLVAALVFLTATLVTVFLLVGQRREARQLATGYDQMSVALSQTRGQLDAVTAKLNALATPTPPPPVVEEAAPAPKPAPTRKVRPKQAHRKAESAPVDDPRWKQVQSELAEHQKQLESNRQDLDKTRTDLEGKLTSARDELNGSIARNHAELVELQRRGEKNYFEFDLSKSKLFNRAGPLRISLRKTNSKRLYCDLELLVDDNQISKKHVNLDEPVLLYPADYGQPLEVVVNDIDKNQVRGYVSVPKFRKSELAAASATQPTGTPSTAQPSTSTVSLEHRPAAP